VNEHTLCRCGSQQPAKHWDRLLREAICDDCVDLRLNDAKQPSFASHPYGRFSRIYTQAELEALRHKYPFEQRLQDLDGKTDEWFPTCVICEQQIKRRPDGEAEWFILPNGSAVCADQQCMDAVGRKPA
jgi:hypothetical protein